MSGFARPGVALGLGALMSLGVGVSPASAAGACVGSGTSQKGAPIYFPGIGPEQTTTFEWTLTVLEACTPTSPVGGAAPDISRATGVITGWCKLFSGQGVFASGERFSFRNVGGVVVITGDVLGVAQVEPNMLGGQNCIAGAVNCTLNLVVAKV